MALEYNGRLMLALIGDEALAIEDRAYIKNPLVGGIILFARNYKDSEQLKELTADIRRCAAPRRVVIAVDQEGGRVARFRGSPFTDIPSMQVVGASAHAAEAAHAVGIVLATELRAHDIDFTFAPVMDVDYGLSKVIGDRSFSESPQVVAECGMALVRGLREGGMYSCAKHFAGHGFAVADSHTDLPRDPRTLTGMLGSDLVPFQHYAAAGVLAAPLMMSAHLVYPQVDELPVTFSARWLKEVLRTQVGYDGLVVCDDLSMKGAALVYGELRERMRRAWTAGCDLLLVCDKSDLVRAVLAWENLQAILPPPRYAHASWTMLAAPAAPAYAHTLYEQARALIDSLR